MTIRLRNKDLRASARSVSGMFDVLKTVLLLNKYLNIETETAIPPSEASHSCPNSDDLVSDALAPPLRRGGRAAPLLAGGAKLVAHLAE